MKVLVVHNHYRSEFPSGENAVVHSEVETLRSAGVSVVTYFRSSDEIAQMGLSQRAALAVRPIRSHGDDREIADTIKHERPDVMHVHNVFPLISPQVLRVAHDLGVPVVQTVHNHRFVCINGTYYREGHHCTDCFGKRLPYPSVMHSCYRGSLPQSAVMATAITMHRRTYDVVDRFIAVSHGIVHFLRSIGIDDERIRLKPNSVPDPGPPDIHQSGSYLFVGRLTTEKGVRVLAKAWDTFPDGRLGTLRVVGDGPERDSIEELARRRSDVEFVGPLPPEQVAAEMRGAGVIVVPSQCPEAGPRVIVEAFSHGRPVLATNLGGMRDIVRPGLGWTVDPSHEALRDGLLVSSREMAPRLQERARREYEDVYAPGVVLDGLLSIYQSVTGGAA